MSLQFLKGVGPARFEILQKLDITMIIMWATLRDCCN